MDGKFIFLLAINKEFFFIKLISLYIFCFRYPTNGQINQQTPSFGDKRTSEVYPKDEYIPPCLFNTQVSKTKKYAFSDLIVIHFLKNKVPQKDCNCNIIVYDSPTG